MTVIQKYMVKRINYPGMIKCSTNKLALESLHASWQNAIYHSAVSIGYLQSLQGLCSFIDPILKIMTKTYKVGITNYFQHIPNTIVYTTFCDTYVFFCDSQWFQLYRSFKIISNCVWKKTQCQTIKPKKQGLIGGKNQLNLDLRICSINMASNLSLKKLLAVT